MTHDLLDIERLALAVDARVRALPSGLEPARLFGVRVRRDVVLVPMWCGVARELPPQLAPPRDVLAIALETEGWAAPMEPDGSVRHRPSRHPQRRRVHHTVLVYGDGADLSVLRYDGDAAPVLMRDGVGVVLDLLVACWMRRRT